MHSRSIALVATKAVDLQIQSTTAGQRTDHRPRVRRWQLLLLFVCGPWVTLLGSACALCERVATVADTMFTNITVLVFILASHGLLTANQRVPVGSKWSQPSVHILIRAAGPSNRSLRTRGDRTPHTGSGCEQSSKCNAHLRPLKYVSEKLLSNRI
jgi:hypothetical protein